jgi:V/A-type H+-transporting ATPase subunit I
MAVLPVEKIHIVVYKSIKDGFLQELQKEGIVHITEQEESTSRVSAELGRIDDALTQLTTYKKRNPLSMFFNIKRPVSYQKFVALADSYDHTKTVARLESIRAERDKVYSRIRQIEDEIALLLPWAPLDADLSALQEFKETDALAAMIPSAETFAQMTEDIADIPHSGEKINTIGKTEYHLFFAKKEQSAQLRARLIENGCEIMDLHSFKGVCAELIKTLSRDLVDARKKIEELNELETRLADEIDNLEATADLLSVVHKKQDLAETLPETIRTTNIVGWILRRNLKRLEKIVEKFGLVFYEQIEKEPGENPPVALRNATISRPYEMLVKLYSMPNPKEYDPTPFLAVFFPVMFGLCITDALYGILLILISLFLMRRVTGDKSLFKILLVGGILTILAGAMVGGWGGDIFEYIGFQPLIDFRNTFMLFDPVTDPMIFIAIALGLGFVHMMFGIGIEIYDDFKNGEYSQAIFANLTWFIILPSIILYFTIFSSSPPAKMMLEVILWTCIVGVVLASHPEGHPNVFDQIIWAPILFLAWYAVTSFAFGFLGIQYVTEIPSFAYLLAVPLLIVGLTRRKEMKKVLGKAAWGLYNLYGISSYLGVLLSYVRLMALGMVTGVIAIAINKIAWMITGIPVIGIVLVIIILIPSHLFNLIINVLGGFIHTMRLQYIEFFGRFYSGGSKPFKPFQMETDYVEIK